MLVCLYASVTDFAASHRQREFSKEGSNCEPLAAILAAEPDKGQDTKLFNMCTLLSQQDIAIFNYIYTHTVQSLNSHW